MARSVIEFLDGQEEELVHVQSLRLLEDLGVLIRSDSVLSMLGNATVDEKKRIAKIPESIVTEALKSCPKEVRLCAQMLSYRETKTSGSSRSL